MGTQLRKVSLAFQMDLRRGGVQNNFAQQRIVRGAQDIVAEGNGLKIRVKFKKLIAEGGLK